MNSKLHIFLIIIVLGSLGAVTVSATLNENTSEVYTVVPTDIVDDGEPLILVFEKVVGSLYTYKLEFYGEDVKITYTFDNYEPIIERGKYINGKIIVNSCDNCYELINTACDECQMRWELCVYNPETDGMDCYSYNDLKSNGIVLDLP